MATPAVLIEYRLNEPEIAYRLIAPGRGRNLRRGSPERTAEGLGGRGCAVHFMAAYAAAGFAGHHSRNRTHRLESPELDVEQLEIQGLIGRLEFLICKVIWLIDLDMLFLVRGGGNSGF